MSHNEKGEAVYCLDLEEPLKFWAVPSGDKQPAARFELGYTTEGFPVPLSDDQDLSQFKESYAPR